MNLYLVQDDDRPLYVIADNWDDARLRWRAAIAGENPEEDIDSIDPTGIHKLCEANELLLPGPRMTAAEALSTLRALSGEGAGR